MTSSLNQFEQEFLFAFFDTTSILDRNEWATQRPRLKYENSLALQN